MRTAIGVVVFVLCVAGSFTLGYQVGHRDGEFDRSFLEQNRQTDLGATK